MADIDISVAFDSKAAAWSFAEPPALLGFSELCTVRRFLRKGLDLITIGTKVLGLDETTFRDAYADALRQWGVSSGDQIEAEIQRQIAEGNGQDAVTTYRQPPNTDPQCVPAEVGSAVVDLVRLKQFLRLEGDVEAFIKKGGFDADEFRGFMQKNQKYLDLIAR